DETSFTNFCERFANSSVESRINSAFYGKSHRSNVSGSYLLLRNTKHTHPVVVWFEEDTFNCPVSQSCIAVLVENLENYIAVDQLSIVLEKCGVSVNINQVDVIYASGNQVTNQLHGPFLQKYEQIFCLFDIDLGALKMYQSLIQLLPDINLNFIYPADIAERLNVSERRMCVAERTGLLSYIGISPEIDQLIQFMRNNGTKLEQETYLDTPD
ncbi:MAG: hypothetical protein MJK13_08605, partial [Pseudomonadales bacterium]|nr:hypothetical protein [Pseudomonadales bacterium]